MGSSNTYMYLKRLLCKFHIADRKVGSILRSLKSMGESWNCAFLDGTHHKHSENMCCLMRYNTEWENCLFCLGAIFFGLERPLQSYDITMLWCSNWVVRASDSDLRKRDCSRGTIALSGRSSRLPNGHPKRIMCPGMDPTSTTGWLVGWPPVQRGKHED